MDEQPKRFRQILAWLWLPPALLLMVPVVALFAIALYLRAAAIGLAMLVRAALKYRTPSVTATQGPHLFKVSIGASVKGERSA